MDAQTREKTKMILEDATYEAFGYYPHNLPRKGRKSILTACETGGTLRIVSKHAYRTFCKACSSKGENFTKESLSKHGINGEKNYRFNGGKTKRICSQCGKEFEVYNSKSRIGRGVFCSKKCLSESQKGKGSPNYRGGRIASNGRSKAERRKLGYTLLISLKDREEGHHITDEYVIGIPADVHKKLGGGKSRRRHRTKVLQWLKANDKKKYIKVLCILAKEPLK